MSGFSFEDLSVDATVPNVLGSPAPAAKPKPARAKPKAKAKKPAASNETANVQIVFYMTPTEASRLKEMLDGRPVSSWMRKKVNSMIESGDV